MAALRGECVWMIPLDGESTGKPERLFEGKYGRIRDVVVAPDESLWVTTSNTDSRSAAQDDRILRVTLDLYSPGFRYDGCWSLLLNQREG